jgi:hypothetical protein
VPAQITPMVLSQLVLKSSKLYKMSRLGALQKSLPSVCSFTIFWKDLMLEVQISTKNTVNVSHLDSLVPSLEIFF